MGVGWRGERVHTDRPAVLRPPYVGLLPRRRRPQLDRLCLARVHRLRYHRLVPARQARRASRRVPSADEARYEVERCVTEDGGRLGAL